MMSFAPLLCVLLIGADSDPFYKQRAEIEKLIRGGPAEARKALRILDQMETALDEREDKDWRLYARWRRATCSYRIGRYLQARQELEEAIKDAPEKHLIRFFMERDLGEFCLRGWKIAMAKTHLESALARAEDLRKNPVTFKASEKAGYRPPEAEIVRIRLLNAECFMYLGENEKAAEAIVAIEKTIEATRQKGGKQPDDWEYLAISCQGHLSELERRAGNVVGGIERLRACLDNLRKIEKRKKNPEAARMQLVQHINLAQYYSEIARFRDAEAELECAREVLARIPSEQNAADLEGNRARLLFEEINFSFEQDLERKDLLDRLAQAERLAQKSILGSKQPDFSTVSRIDLLAQIHELRGRVFSFRGEPVKAAEHYRAAGRSYDRVVDRLEASLGPTHDYVLQVRRRRARLALLRGTAEDIPAARSEARAAFELFAKSHGKDDVGRGEFLQLLVAIESRAGKFKEAAEWAEEHRKLSARRLVPYLAGLTAPEQIKFFRMWDDPGLHAGLRLGTHDEELRERSCEWLINGKAKIAEVHAAVNHLARGSEQFMAFQRSVRRQAYLLHGLPDAEDKNLMEGLLQEEARQRELVGKRPFKPGKTWYTLKELRERLGPDEVFIDVVCLRPEENVPRVYYAWVIPRAGKISLVELGKAGDIEPLIKKFVEHQEEIVDILRRMSVARAEEKLHGDCLDRLSRLVLDPIWKVANKFERWTISPDGPLWGIPWEALALPIKGKHRFLYAVEQIKFRYVLSGRDVVKEPSEKVTSGDPWILADPEFDRAPPGGGWRAPGDVPVEARSYTRTATPLEHAQAEGKEVADSLKDYFTAGKPRVQSRRATKEALLKLTRSPRVLYLSTHGFSPLNARNLPVDEPLLCCGVALAGFNFIPKRTGKIAESLPGLMTGAEVLALDLRGTELVVLSACQTGAGVTHYGQSPADLRHAFHLAGARAVVAALWSVDDRSTKDVMVHFMQLLARRKLADKSAALNAAQRKKIDELRNSREYLSSHPFFWAGLTLSGS
jgi:CHAT domain-containing protein